MPTLYVLSGGDLGKRFPIEGASTLGRAPDCDVRLRDRSISRRHARLEHVEGTWLLCDLDSRNGVRLGQELIDEVPLEDLDEFLLGEVLIRFRTRAEDGEGAEDGLEFQGDVPVTVPPSGPEADADPIGGTGPSNPRGRGGEPTAIQIEEDIDLGTGAHPLKSAPSLPRAQPDERMQERARLLATESRGGLLGGDLSQRPLWQMTLILLVAFGLLGGSAWLVFQLVVGARGG